LAHILKKNLSRFKKSFEQILSLNARTVLDINLFNDLFIDLFKEI